MLENFRCRWINRHSKVKDHWFDLYFIRQINLHCFSKLTLNVRWICIIGYIVLVETILIKWFAMNEIYILRHLWSLMFYHFYDFFRFFGVNIINFGSTSNLRKYTNRLGNFEITVKGTRVCCSQYFETYQNFIYKKLCPLKVQKVLHFYLEVKTMQNRRKYFIKT